MARDGYLILDSDLHMMEPGDLWARYLDAPLQPEPAAFLWRPAARSSRKARKTRPTPTRSWAWTCRAWRSRRTTCSRARPCRAASCAAAAASRHPHFNVARANAFDAPSTLTAMDIEGIDVAVMYGTRGRQILCHDDLAPDYAAALARAYNNWAADYCKTDPTRLKFAAQLAMHDVGLAVEEAKRCVNELGAVAVVGTPNPVNGQHLHDEAVEPLWNALEELNVPIGFHPTGNTALKDDAGRRYVGHANFHPIAHAIRNPVELMGAIASLTTGGVLERHPEAARGLPRRHRRLAALVAVAARRPVGEIRPRLRAATVDGAERIFQAAMLHRARCRRGAGGRGRQPDRAPTISSCRATTRIPTARSPRRWSSSSGSAQ